MARISRNKEKKSIIQRKPKNAFKYLRALVIIDILLNLAEIGVDYPKYLELLAKFAEYYLTLI